MRAGKDRLTAILEAGHKRARPIVMTTVAMVAGMMPVAHRDRRRRRVPRSPMAIAVIGGLITSTALTLVIVPAAFTLIDDIERWLGAASSAACSPRSRRTAAAAARSRIRSTKAECSTRGLARQSRPPPAAAPQAAPVRSAWWVRLVSRLPLPVLYGLSSLLGWLAFRVFPYREHVVRENLTQGLPRPR